MDRVTTYLSGVVHLLENAPVEDIRGVADLLVSAHHEGRRVFVMGNGGSAATASHFAGDLQKGVGCTGSRFRVMALTDSIPLITAWANDSNYENIFAEQLAAWVEPDDVVIGISGSGNSMNVINAIELANKQRAVTVGISGYGGGRLAKTAQRNIIIHSDDMQYVEDVHVVITHLVFRYVLGEITC